MLEQHPQPPAGFQRPGIPGAGNLLDPAVRADLREQLHAAVPQPGAVAEARASQENAPVGEATPAPAAPSASAPRSLGAGPFPHGDVDLRGMLANVPPEPIRPQRNLTGRRFYFLTSGPAAVDAPSPPVPADGRPALKPG
jgi:hypothetical protein